MKNVLLSADSEISVFAVPDPVADHLEKYCLEFCRNWLHKSPDAEKYRQIERRFGPITERIILCRDPELQAAGGLGGKYCRIEEYLKNLS